MNYAVIAASIKKIIIGRKTKSIIAALLLAGSGAFAQVPSYVPTSGLVGWWPFNGNANDESGNGNNGMVQNGASLTLDRYGNSNSTYDFDGNDDQIYINNSSSLSPNQYVTVNSWIYPRAYEDGKFILVKGSHVNLSTRSYGLLGPESNQKAQFRVSNSNTEIGVYSSTNISLNSWTMVTGVYDGNSIKIFVNGVFDGQISLSGLINQTSEPLTFGSHKYYNFSDYWYNGKIDDIGIWNRALTQQEITALYNAQSCNSTNNTITADGPTTFCAGNFVNLTSDVAGATYQWKRNGINITTNGTSKTYKASSTGSYTCVATCNGTALTSNAIAVTSKTNAAASVSASGATSFCTGDSVTLNCTNLGSNYSVQWYRTNISMENATAYSQVVKQPGTYKVVTKNLTNGCSRISGSSAVVAVNCRIAGDITSGTPTPLSESEAKFTANELSQGVNIFPNPNNGSFTFAYDGEEYGDAVLQVINSMGQMIYNTNVNVTEGGYTQELQLGENSTKGIYIVRLLINGNSYDSRVLVR